MFYSYDGVHSLTFHDICRLFPQTSFAVDSPITDIEGLETYLPTDRPECDPLVSEVIEDAPRNGLQQWKIIPLNQEEVERRIASKSLGIRAMRNQLLQACDWTQLPDAQCDKNAWAEYRQQLRDLTNGALFPFSVEWPTSPTPIEAGPHGVIGGSY